MPASPQPSDLQIHWNRMPTIPSHSGTSGAHLFGKRPILAFMHQSAAFSIKVAKARSPIWNMRSCTNVLLCSFPASSNTLCPPIIQASKSMCGDKYLGGGFFVFVLPRESNYSGFIYGHSLCLFLTLLFIVSGSPNISPRRMLLDRGRNKWEQWRVLFLAMWWERQGLVLQPSWDYFPDLSALRFLMSTFFHWHPLAGQTSRLIRPQITFHPWYAPTFLRSLASFETLGRLFPGTTTSRIPDQLIWFLAMSTWHSGAV